MGLFNAIMSLSGMIDIDLTEGEALARHTTYRVGGPCELFICCHSVSALRRAASVLNHEKIPWVVIGKGSNLLVSDAGYRGAVITLGREFQRTQFDDDSHTVTVGAAVLLAHLVNDTLRRGISGFEFAVGIPGTVGGAISMNAGTRDDWVGSRVDRVVTYNASKGIKQYEGDAIAWDYRETSLPGNEIILETTFKYDGPVDRNLVCARAERYFSRRKHSQPIGVASCGSVFLNPPEKSVGALIEACGLKGFSIGGARVSDVHANFIVNTGSASADDVMRVIKHVHRKVKDTYGIELKPEVKFLGF